MNRTIYPSDFIYIPLWGSASELNEIDEWLAERTMEHQYLGVNVHPETFQPHARYVIYDEKDALLFRLRWSTKIRNN